MFGLTFREKLFDIVKQACETELYVYSNSFKSKTKTLANDLDLSDESVHMAVLNSRDDYNRAIYAKIKNIIKNFGGQSPILFELATISPKLAGLPADIALILSGHTYPAYIIFALAYYSVTKNDINSEKLNKAMIEINNYQESLIKQASQLVY